MKVGELKEYLAGIDNDTEIAFIKPVHKPEDVIGKNTIILNRVFYKVLDCEINGQWHKEPTVLIEGCDRLI